MKETPDIPLNTAILAVGVVAMVLIVARSIKINMGNDREIVIKTNDNPEGKTK